MARRMRRIHLKLRRRWRLLLLTGRRVECPCCGGRFRSFMIQPPRGVAVCPRCGAQERHRALWLWLSERTNLLRDQLRVLHWAPEGVLERRLRAAPNLDYRSADLDPSKGELQLDITDIDMPDDSFDVILCIHVLEHIPDDARAMRELHRVLRPGGWMVALVPLDLSRESTYEDAAVVSATDREREFWQHDHVRLYGRDFADRLRAASFDVEVDEWVRSLPPETIERHGLFPQEDMYVCRKGESGTFPPPGRES